MLRPLTAVLTCLLLAACGGADKPAAPVVATPPPPPQKTVLDTQLKALEKAKAVQDVVDKQAAEAQKKVDDSGG